MDFLELVSERYSVRKYEQRGIEKEKLDYVLECARLAPLAVNRQPWKLIVAQSEEARAALCQCYHNEWFAQAPVIIAVCVDADAAWTRPNDGKNHADIDGSIAAEHICLAAASQGLGTCWVCNFDMAATRTALNLPDNVHPVVLIPIGYPADTASTRHTVRKAASEIVEYI